MGFDGSKKTETGEHKGKEDDKEPDWKLLDKSQIGKQVSLQGVPTCTDGTIINGDCQQFVKVNREAHILGNDTLLIQGSQVEDVEQTATIVVKQGRDVMVGVQETLEVQGNRFVWVHDSDTEHYLLHREINEPVERVEHKHSSFEYGWTSAEVMGIAAETKALSIAIENVKVEAKMFEMTNQLIEQQMKALTSKAEMMDLRFGLLLLALKTKLNGDPNFATSTPVS